MKRWVLALVWVVIGVFVLYAAAGLLLRFLVPGSVKDTVVSKLSASIGVPVTVETAQFDFGSWMKLQPAISLGNVALGNPPGFRGAHMLEAKKMAARVELIPLFSREVQVRSIAIDAPRVTIEKNAAGDTKFEKFLKGIPSSKSEESSSKTTVSVDRIDLTDGVVTAPGLALRQINLTARDLAEGSQCRLELAAKMFAGPRSGFRLEGSAGPFAAATLPINGKLTFEIAPAEMPARLRQEQFGEWLKSPGAKALVKLEASVQGDVYGTIAGPAKLTISDFLVGREQKQLPLAGDMPATFTASKLVSQPDIQLLLPKASVKLGGGEWRGSAELRMKGSALAGATRGSIKNVDINDVLTAFTTAGGKVFGTLEVPNYNVQFSGKDSADLKRSLSGKGKLTIQKGRLAALDMLASLQQALSASSEAGAKGNTPFTSLDADYELRGGAIDFSSIVLDSPALRCSGKGTIGADQSLNFALETKVSGGVGRMVNQLVRRGGEDATLPVTVTGTVDNPRVRPNMRSVATGVAQGLFQSLFSKKPQK